MSKRKQLLEIEDDDIDEPIFMGQLREDDTLEAPFVSSMASFPCFQKGNQEMHIARGKSYNRQARMIVLNVLKWHRDQNQRLVNRGQSGARCDAVQRTAEMCKVAANTVRTIERQAKESPLLSSPNKTRKKRVSVDSLMVTTIRRTIHSIYEKNKYFSVNELLQQLRANNSFPYGVATLLAILKSNGFR